MTLSAQTAPPQFPWVQRFPGVPQFTVTPEAPLVRPETGRAVRELVLKHNPDEAAVCSIPLLEAPVAKNLEPMPVLRPRAENIDRMPLVKLPAPPCEEEKR